LQPSVQPSSQPSGQPSAQPSTQPSTSPSTQPLNMLNPTPCPKRHWGYWIGACSKFAPRSKPCWLKPA
jgi:hypothetical protein